MLPVQALPIILRYFDGLDAVVAKRLLRKRPWQEVALTQLLCDVLDDDTTDDYPRPYSRTEFEAELLRAVPMVTATFTVQTHQYPANVERWVTQSDLGLVIDYNDHFFSDERQTAWLLQAKRLFPHPNTRQYTETSRFESDDRAQRERIHVLNEVLGFPAAKFLLYCPRPDGLDALTAAKLAHLRNSTLSENIFDFATGLALHQDLVAGAPTVAAGIIVADAAACPTSLASAHMGMFDKTLPLSWFVALQLAADEGLPTGRRLLEGPDAANKAEFVYRLAAGDTEAAQQVIQRTGARDIAFPVLPAHTLRIKIEAGGKADPELRAIRLGG